MIEQHPYLNYLKYVRDVLGVRHLMSEPSPKDLSTDFYQPDPNLKLEQKWDLIFVNCLFSSVESLFEPENFELFEKILQAMKLSKKKVLFVDSPLHNEKEILRRWYPFGLPKVLIMMKEQAEAQAVVHYKDETAVIETYNPYMLRHQTDLKKLAWNHLKSVLALL